MHRKNCQHSDVQGGSLIERPIKHIEQLVKITQNALDCWPVKGKSKRIYNKTRHRSELGRQQLTAETLHFIVGATYEERRAKEQMQRQIWNNGPRQKRNPMVEGEYDRGNLIPEPGQPVRKAVRQDRE